eukprot:783617-Rhodomonas_salina.1
MSDGTEDIGEQRRNISMASVYHTAARAARRRHHHDQHHEQQQLQHHHHHHRRIIIIISHNLVIIISADLLKRLPDGAEVLLGNPAPRVAHSDGDLLNTPRVRCQTWRKSA